MIQYHTKFQKCCDNPPSLPFQGDQAVNAHATTPLLRGEGLVYRTIRLSTGDDQALPGLWGGEAEETGHSEESGVEGEGEWSERGRLGVRVGWGRRGGGS